MNSERPEAIILVGNLIVDYVKTVKRMPTTGALAEILSVERHTGGAPMNVAMNLRDMDTQLPLHCLGCIGRDADGDYIIEELKKRKIHSSGIQQQDTIFTSFTDVISSIEDKERTFFYYCGANELLTPHALESAYHLPAKILHLGYLNLLPGMQSSPEDLIKALDKLQNKNVKISLDMVSGGSPQEVRQSILPILHHINYLIINEVELGILCAKNFRSSGGLDKTALSRSLEKLGRETGMEITVAHYPEGATAFDGRNCLSIPSMEIPADEIKGKVGAGDAYCTGILYGLYQGYPLEHSLKLAGACAISSMKVSGAVGGVPPARKLENMIH